MAEGSIEKTLQLSSIIEEAISIEARLRTWKVKIPDYIYGLELLSRASQTICYCAHNFEKESSDYFTNLLGYEENFKFISIDAPVQLSGCMVCSSQECPSLTTNQSDINLKEWVGPGSPIFVIDTEEWNNISDDDTKSLTLNELLLKAGVRQKHKHLDNVLSYSTIGCILVSKNHAKWSITTTSHIYPFVHTAKKRTFKDEKVTFLTQVLVNDNSKKLIKIGSLCIGVFDPCNAYDILVIDLCPSFDKNLLQIKLNHPCLNRYIDIKSIDEAEPIIDSVVAKRGFATGNTYGKIRSKLYLSRSLDYLSDPVFIVECDDNSPRFAAQGDSGSMVVKASTIATGKVEVYGFISHAMQIYNENKDELGNGYICTRFSKNIEALNFGEVKEEITPPALNLELYDVYDVTSIATLEKRLELQKDEVTLQKELVLSFTPIKHIKNVPEHYYNTLAKMEKG